jgi:hypothetical protein
MLNQLLLAHVIFGAAVLVAVVTITAVDWMEGDGWRPDWPMLARVVALTYVVYGVCALVGVAIESVMHANAS